MQSQVGTFVLADLETLSTFWPAGAGVDLPARLKGPALFTAAFLCHVADANARSPG
jgi:hypothetical protein